MMEDEIMIVPSGPSDSYCRLCFSEANIEVLISEDSVQQVNEALISMINRYIRIPLGAAKDAPCGICSTCRMMLEEFQRFRERCLRCDFILTGIDREARQDEDFEAEANSLQQESNDTILPILSKTCSLCITSFPTIVALRHHAREIHGCAPPVYKCPICSMQFQGRREYNKHSRSHQNVQTFPCEICKYIFYSPSCLDQHQQTCRISENSAENGNGVFRCRFCSRIFTTRDHLMHHEKFLHPDDHSPPSNKKQKLDDGANSTPTPVSLQPSSTVLDEGAPVPPLAMLSGREQRSIQIPIGASVPPLVPLAGSKALIASSTCNAAVVNGHSSQENAKKPFECSSCGIRFYFVGSLKRHLKETHARQPTKEEINPSVIEQPPDQLAIVPIQDEMMNLMSDSSINQCKSAETRPCVVALKRLDDTIIPPILNQEIHLGKFYHALQKAKADYENNDGDLDEEIKKFYPNYVENVQQLFYCPYCFKSFPRRISLTNHKRRHTRENFKCQECDREFPDKSSMRRHMLLHSDELPYQCDECPVSFVQNASLLRHKARYHGPNPQTFQLFYCHMCPRVYMKERFLRNHIAFIHVTGESEPPRQMKAELDSEMLVEEF